MFNSLRDTFTKQKEHRRFTRKKMSFKFVWMKGGEQVPGVGSDLSEGGCLIATRDTPPAEFDAIFDLGKHRFPLRLRKVRAGEFTRDGKRYVGVGCAFSGIAADHYDALVRVLKDIPESGNAARAELAAKDRSDDAYRLLPLAVQQRVLGVLVKAGRIMPPPEGHAPLLRMEDLGRTADGQRLAVHSRIASHDGPKMFDSVIVIDPKGTVKLES